MSGLLLSSLDRGILRLCLNDAASRNSLSEAMIAALKLALDDATTDEEVRVIVISAAGPVYSSGHNLKELILHRKDSDSGAAYYASLFQSCAELMSGIVRHPKPVIAEVQGTASAAGCQLVASCDVAVASENARFCTPGVNIGLFCSTPMVALSRNVGQKQAMEMLLTGDAINADEAFRIGLVNRVVSPNMLPETVENLALKIAGKSQMTIKTGKAAFHAQRYLSLEDAYALTTRVMSENMLKQDADEGIGAFLEKREPHWKDQ